MAGAPLHILVLPTWYPNSRRPDYAVFFRVQTKALKKAGAQVGVIFPEMRETSDRPSLASVLENRFQISEAAPDGYPVLRWSGWRLPFFHEASARVFVRAAQRLYRAYVRRYGVPDLILAHTAINAGWAARAINARHGVPYVVVEHSTHFARGFYSDAALARARAAFQDAAAVYAVSEPFAVLLRAQFDLPVDCAPNAIDTDFFAPDLENLAPRRPHHPLRLAFVGTMDDKKGVDVLIDAVAKLPPEAPVDLRLIGEGAAQARYEAQARRLGVESRVTFLGPAGQTQVRDLMRWADLFVSPSRFETFGVVVIEALATGTPVVATACGGPEAIVRDPRHGALVSPGDAAAFAAAIQDQSKRLAAAPSDLPQILNADVAARFGADGRAQDFLARAAALLNRK